MDEVINSISSYSWWIMTSITATVAIIIASVLRRTPATAKKLSRNLAARRKLKIKKARWNQSLVFYQISKANSFFLVFIIVSCVYIAWLSSGQLLHIIKQSVIAGIILSSPIYIAELLWLINDNYAKDLIKSRGKITKK